MTKMLIHGRLVVTPHGCMLDEVKSLLQKALRRGEQQLAFQAAKELITGPTDQLKWPNIVTFMFEDHCLNHVEIFERLYRLYRDNDKFGTIELISKCYTCRMAACLQVVALNDTHRQYDRFWNTDMTEFNEVKGLINTVNKGINADQLLANIVKKWREKDTEALISLFGLVNMAAKVEGRTLTESAKGIVLEQDKNCKKQTLYHLVLSILYRNTTDEYMKRVIKTCFRFASIPGTPQGLILFTALVQLMYQPKVLDAAIPEIEVGSVKWNEVQALECMPGWAVDKHTYRGKFGKSSEHLFLKKFKNIPLSENKLKEFHGERPKADLRVFFDVGCVCNNDILPENPYWEDAKSMYLKQKPSLQKCARMTKMYYHELVEEKSIVCVANAKSASRKDQESKTSVKRKKQDDDTFSVEMPPIKIAKTSSATSKQENISASVERPNTTFQKGPLLQLPTGSGKVYTALNLSTMKVFKGPYKSKERKNLCIFLHRAMREVFGDKHSMEVSEDGNYLVFPLLKAEGTDLRIVHREFYDCIAKQQVSEEDGQFIERESLGIVQLHKLPVGEIVTLPVSVWLHFMWRYVLNIGDTGLYNAIATKDLKQIYGIDMEEKRNQVKGSDVINMMFGKLPRKDICREVQRTVLGHKQELIECLSTELDFEKLGNLFKTYQMRDETEVCKARLAKLKSALSADHV